MKTSITILVWLFVPLLMVEAVVCNGGPRVTPAAASRALALGGCAGQWPAVGERAVPSAREC